MSAIAVELAVVLSVPDQLKLAILDGINRRLDELRKQHETWRGVAESLDWETEDLSRVRSRHYTHFSLTRLIDLATQVGARISLTIN